LLKFSMRNENTLEHIAEEQTEPVTIFRSLPNSDIVLELTISAEDYQTNFERIWNLWTSDSDTLYDFLKTLSSFKQSEKRRT